VAGGDVPQELAPYLNYGVLGLVLIGAITGLIHFRPTVDRMLAGKDEVLAAKDEALSRAIEAQSRAEAQRDAAIAIAQEQIVPLLTTFVTTTQTLIPLLQEIVREGTDDHRRPR
jgi:hypothetical protein